MPAAHRKGIAEVLNVFPKLVGCPIYLAVLLVAQPCCNLPRKAAPGVTNPTVAANGTRPPRELETGSPAATARPAPANLSYDSNGTYPGEFLRCALLMSGCRASDLRHGVHGDSIAMAATSVAGNRHRRMRVDSHRRGDASARWACCRSTSTCTAKRRCARTLPGENASGERRRPGEAAGSGVLRMLYIPHCSSSSTYREYLARRR